MNLALQYGHPGTPDFGMQGQNQPLGLPPGLVSYLHPSTLACLQGLQGIVFSEPVQYGDQSNALSNLFPGAYSSDLALRLAAAGLPNMAPLASASMAAMPQMAGVAVQLSNVSMQHLAQQIYQAQQNIHHHQQQQQRQQAQAHAQLQMGQQLYLYQRAHQAPAAPAAPASSPPRAPTVPVTCEPRRQPAPAAPKKRPTIAVSSPDAHKLARESEWKTDPSVPVRSKQRAAPFERWSDAPQPPSKKSRTNPRPSENAPKTGPVEKSADGLPASLSPREPDTPTGPSLETPDAALYRAHGFKGRGRVGMAGGLRGLCVPLSGADGPYLRSLDYRTFGTVLSLGCDIARALFPDPRTAEKEPLPVILVDPEGTEWVCMYHALVCKHSYVLRSGWRKFVETNNVLKHDIVVLGKDPRGPDAAGRYRIRIEVVSKKVARASLGLVPLGAFDMHRFRRDSLETGEGDAEPARAIDASVSTAGAGACGLAGPEEGQAGDADADADADAKARSEPSASMAEPLDPLDGSAGLDAPALSDSNAATCEAEAPEASVNP